MKTIAVFTPTYNRAACLKRVYGSLVSQTDYDFLWLIVDDGSTDDTRELVEEFKREGIIDIEYQYQENGGKNKAHNTAVTMCRNPYILILDSDDYLTKDAISILNKKIELIKNNENISGIIGNRINPNNGRVIGTEIPKVKVASGNELYQKYGFYGDTLRLYKTKILKQYLFPEICGEKFIPENVVFDPIDVKYKMLVIEEKLYIGEYQEDGYSKNIVRLHKDNPMGYYLSLKSSADTAVTIKKKISYTILLILWQSYAGIEEKEKFHGDTFLKKLCIPVAKIFEKMRKPSFFYDGLDD